LATFLPILRETEKPEQMPAIVMIGAICTFLFTGCLAFTTYYAWGSALDQPVVTEMLPAVNPFVQMLKIVFCVNLAVSYPIHGTVIMKSLTENILNRNYFEVSADKSMTYTVNFIRALVPLLGLIVTITVCDYLDKVLSIIGCTTSAIMVIFVPTMIHYGLVAKTKFEKGSDITLMSIAVLLLVIGPAAIINSWQK
jgi:amino acid permease